MFRDIIKILFSKEALFMTNTIGNKIKMLRKRRNMTQEELGDRIGVTKATINKYETGVVVNLRRPTIEKLARALDTSPAYLMGWVDENNGNNISVNGSNNGDIHINSGSELSKEEKELLRIYASLDVKKRMDLLSYAFKLEEK